MILGTAVIVYIIGFIAALLIEWLLRPFLSQPLRAECESTFVSALEHAIVYPEVLL